MKIKYVRANIINLDDKEEYVKLPKTNKNLYKILLKKNIIDFEENSYTALDFKTRSVIGIDIKNFKIKSPTNIYYLNCYLDLLKSNDLDVPEEEIEINTDKLKELIADILSSDNKNMNLDEIYQIINSEEKDNIINTNETKDEVSSEEEKNSFSSKSKAKKLSFSLEELKKYARERKGK